MIQEHQYRSDSRGGPCVFKYYVVPCGRSRDDHSEVDYITRAADHTHAPTRTRSAFILHVDLDPAPGTFHTPYSAYLNINSILKNGIPAYNPLAILASSHPQKNENNGRDRICFFILVDLDPLPGSFHTQESAQNWVGMLFQRTIAHYNPTISLAPASVQPYLIINKEGKIEV